ADPDGRESIRAPRAANVHERRALRKQVRVKKTRADGINDLLIRRSAMAASVRPIIRPLVPADAPGWRRLWDGYLAFYRHALDEETTQATWRRALEGREGMLGRVAELDGTLVGLLHAVIHANTWATAPVCYLEDLYVDPAARRHGVGRAMIEALADEGRQA